MVPEGVEAMIRAVPCWMAVTTPFWSTTAVRVSEEAQVTACSATLLAG